MPELHTPHNTWPGSLDPAYKASGHSPLLSWRWLLTHVEEIHIVNKRDQTGGTKLQKGLGAVTHSSLWLWESMTKEPSLGIFPFCPASLAKRKLLKCRFLGSAMGWQGLRACISRKFPEDVKLPVQKPPSKGPCPRAAWTQRLTSGAALQPPTRRVLTASLNDGGRMHWASEPRLGGSTDLRSNPDPVTGQLRDLHLVILKFLT